MSDQHDIRGLHRVIDVAEAGPATLQTSPAGRTLVAPMHADLAWARGDLAGAIERLDLIVTDPASLTTMVIPDAACQLAVLLDEIGCEAEVFDLLDIRVDTLLVSAYALAMGVSACSFGNGTAEPRTTTVRERGNSAGGPASDWRSVGNSSSRWVAGSKP